MKISKLFHWLYAFIMLMPVFFIAGRVAYVTFNKNAKDSYSGTEITYKKVYEGNTNDIQSVDDIVSGNYYKINLKVGNDTFNEYSVDVELDNVVFYNTLISYGYCDETVFYNNSDASTLNNLHVYLHVTGDDEIQTVLYDYDENNYFWCYIQYIVSTDSFLICQIMSFDYAYNELVPSLVSSCPQEYLPYHFEEVEVSTLDNAFDYSVNQLNEVPIFSWAQTSFLVAPFSYITGLFGIASTSPVNTLLSYWLSISIIWLVFDLVMYLPLLIHRWLDKGVLE